MDVERMLAPPPSTPHPPLHTSLSMSPGSGALLCCLCTTGGGWGYQRGPVWRPTVLHPSAQNRRVCGNQAEGQRRARPLSLLPTRRIIIIVIIMRRAGRQVKCPPPPDSLRQSSNTKTLLSLLLLLTAALISLCLIPPPYRPLNPSSHSAPPFCHFLSVCRQYVRKMDFNEMRRMERKLKVQLSSVCSASLPVYSSAINMGFVPFFKFFSPSSENTQKGHCLQPSC